MSRTTKISLLALGILFAFFLITLAAIQLISNARINKFFQASAKEFSIPADKASIEKGKHLVIAVGKCPFCHGDDLGGAMVYQRPLVGTFYAPNLTIANEHAGKTSSLLAVNPDELPQLLAHGQTPHDAKKEMEKHMEEDKKDKGKTHKEEAHNSMMVGGHMMTTKDFGLAIRHGIGHNDNSLWLMPSESYYYFSDEDLADMLAYIKNLPPVMRKGQENSIGPIGRYLFLKGDLKLLSADQIEHNIKPPAAPKPGLTKEYGKYLVETGWCKFCHGDDLSGGQIAGAPPNTPPATNLTPGGKLKEWSLADFTKMLREGEAPSGRTLSSFMPFKYTKYLTDNEIEATYIYLKSLPAIKGVEHKEEN